MSMIYGILVILSVALAVITFIILLFLVGIVVTEVIDKSHSREEWDSPDDRISR